MSNINEGEGQVPESYPMKGGDGIYSYTKNSSWQKEGLESAKGMIIEAIAEKLDIKQLSATTTTFSIADLGCSVGPNTFIAMQNVLEAVKSKYIAEGLASKIPEFHVFFNDHVSNDFNTLFASLPPERQYFASGVPGSFYNRLFPESSLHFVHSSYAIQWLSKVPKVLLDKNSPAFNRGRVHYYGAPNEVAAAYTAQFGRDMEVFLDARAKELVSGGMLLATIPSIPNDIPHSCAPIAVMFDFLGSCLVDLAKEGLISEDEVDLFNLPIYAASPREMTEVVERNGCFSIERIELIKPRFSAGGGIQWEGNEEVCAMRIRAVLEAILSKHFGSNIVDQLFVRFVKKAKQVSDQLDLSFNKGAQLLIVLKRK